MRCIALVLVALTLAAPHAASRWGLQGSFELDAPEDVQGGCMFLDADVSVGTMPRVYFQAFLVSGAQQPPGWNLVGIGAAVNPNPGPFGSRMMPAAAPEAYAYLGVWKDCNRDGYIGDATTGLSRYRMELGFDPAVCPGAPFQSEGWIWEFSSISPSSATIEKSGHAFYDPMAAVWGDWGLPGADPAADCPLAPLPPGTLSRVGGPLALADCQVGGRFAETVNDVDSEGERGLRFDDPAHPERDCASALNRAFGLYSPTYSCPDDPQPALEPNGTPLVSVFDCDAAPTYDVRDPTAPEGERGALSTAPFPWKDDGVGMGEFNLTDESGSYYRVPALAPGLRPDGTVGDSSSNVLTPAVGGVAVLEGFSECPRGPSTWLWPVAWANPASVEEPNAPEIPKRFADFPFMSVTSVSKGPANRPSATVANHAVSPDYSAFGDAPYYFGVEPLGQAAHEGWYSRAVRQAPPGYNPVLRRDASPAGATYVTFYANVSQATLSRFAVPTVTPATYGAEACGSAISGESGGWDCDASHWWRPEHGAPTASPNAKEARVGWSYLLRDVDCYDNSLDAQPEGVGLAALSEDDECP